MVVITLVLAILCQTSLPHGSLAVSMSTNGALYGDELQRARNARDHADQLRASFEDRYRWSAPGGGPTSGALPTSSMAQQEYRGVVEAYRRVAQQYPNTEVAAYSLLRLSGLYQYCRQFEQGVRTAQEVAEAYAGSHYGDRACFAAGTIELQGLHEPREAIIWFKKIPRPAETEGRAPLGPDGPSREAQLYVAAQLGIVRAEVMIGEGFMAEARAERIGERYPGYADYAMGRLAADRRDFLKSEFQVDPEKLLDDWVSHNPALTTARPRDALSDAVTPVVSGGTGSGRPSASPPRTAKAGASRAEVLGDISNGRLAGLLVGLATLAAGCGVCAIGAYLYCTKRKES